MTKISGKSGGSGTGTAATWKDEATPVRDWINATMHDDIHTTLIPGIIIGWRLKDGTYLSAEEAMERRML